MKRSLFTIMMLLLAVPVLFTGCSKSELADKAINPNDNLTKSSTTVCGTPLVANLAAFGGGNYGTVTVSNDATKLYVNYVTKSGWKIKSLVLYAGLQNGLYPGTLENPTTVNDDGTGLFWMFENSSYYTDMYYPVGYPNIPYAKEVSNWTLQGDLSTLPDCFMVIAMAQLENATGQKLYAWGKAQTQLKNSGYYLEYCKQACEIQTCETAYAYGEDLATCFLTLSGVTSNNWGWSNEITSNIDENWPIYAGAGQCDITKGTLVGQLHVVYDGTNVTVTYNLNPGVTLTGTHLYVGPTYLPIKNGKFTTAPGQFPYKHDAATGTTDTYEIPISSLPIYIAAHAGACWGGGTGK